MAGTWSAGVKILLEALRDRVLRSDAIALCVSAAPAYVGVRLVGMSRLRNQIEEVF